MSNEGTGSGATTQSRPVAQRLKRGLESKVLVPLATTVVSAAASYLLRKLPMIIEERVLPKLREEGAAGTVRDAVSSIAEQAAEVVPALGGTTGDRVSSGAASGDGNGAAPSPPGQRRLSNQEREQERLAREERRRERKRAVQRT